MRALGIVLILLLSGCVESLLIDAGESRGPGSGGGRIVTLRLGETRPIGGGAQLGFLAVRGDSRCPSDVTCVWEGRADIRLALFAAGADTAFLDLFIPGLVATSDDVVHSSADAHGFRVGLIRLDPYPQSRTIIEESEYRARLRVSRL